MLIDWQIVLSYCPNITGIIHAGAHKAEERKVYGDLPAKWIEADPKLFEALTVKDKYNFAAMDYRGTIRLNKMPFSAANSVLEPNLNKRRADVYVEDTVLVRCDKIEIIQEPGYNFLNLDIQGVELQALKGTDLSQIDYIYTEVHRVETYKGCSQIEDIEAYLKDYKRVAISWTKYGWGDALYIRK